MEGETAEPPAGLDGAIFHVLGELQHLQASLGAATQAHQAPQGESELVYYTTSA